MTLSADLSRPALLRVWDALPDARIVGGAVRDHLAGRPIADIDLATPLPPESVAQVLAAADIRVIPTGLAHGTVTALIDGESFEVTTLRRDVATDGRHAVVAFTEDWREDAARRDFTFNALSMDRDGEIHDYFGGQEDLAAGIVRFVGDARARIAEDYLRVLRFFRFFARYGARPPDEPTRLALREAGPSLSILSAERVWSEIRRLLAIHAPGEAIALMAELGILDQIVPGPVRVDRLDRLLAMGAPADPLLRLAALSGADTDAFVAQYRLSSAEADRLAALRGPAPEDDADELGLRQALIDSRTRADLIDRAWLHGRGNALRARIEALPELEFPVQGRDLLSLGWAPGRELGRDLARLRSIWRESGGTADGPALLAQLARPSIG